MQRKSGTEKEKDMNRIANIFFCTFQCFSIYKQISNTVQEKNLAFKKEKESISINLHNST